MGGEEAAIAHTPVHSHSSTHASMHGENQRSIECLCRAKWPILELGGDKSHTAMKCNAVSKTQDFIMMVGLRARREGMGGLSTIQLTGKLTEDSVK